MIKSEAPGCFSCKCIFVRTGSKKKAMCLPCGKWWQLIEDMQQCSQDRNKDQSIMD